MNARKEYSRAYYLANRDRIIAYNKEYRRTHKRETLERVYDWQRRHPLQSSDIHRRYYEKHKEEIKARARRRYWEKKGVDAVDSQCEVEMPDVRVGLC